MINTKKLDEIEKEQAEFNYNWYFHGFTYEPSSFKNMLNEGIKSNILLSQHSQGFNGPFYISLTKNLKLNVNNPHSIYHLYKNNLPLFIIDNKIKTHKCSLFPKFSEFINYPIPLRTSQWEDEYQKFLKIPPNKIIGIQCSLYYWITNNYQKQYYENLKFIILNLYELNKNIPIYDFSKTETDTIHIINKEKYLKLL